MQNNRVRYAASLLRCRTCVASCGSNGGKNGDYSWSVSATHAHGWQQINTPAVWVADNPDDQNGVLPGMRLAC